jgi:hypothetical protein
MDKVSAAVSESMFLKIFSLKPLSFILYPLS